MRKIFNTLVLLGLSPVLLTAADKEQPAAESGIDTQNISSAVKPGDDFYQFVNEGWLSETEIPADQSNYGSFSVLDDEAKEAIRRLIEEAAAENAPQGSESQKVGDFFKSLTDVGLRNKLGIEPIRPLLEQLAKCKNKRQLAKATAGLFRIGIAGPLAGYVSPDAKQSDQYTVYITQAGLTLPDRDYYFVDNPLFEKARQDLRAYIADMLEVVGHPNPKRAAATIVRMETAIARAQWDRVQNRDPEATYNKVTRAVLTESLVDLDMSTFLAESGLAEQEEFVVRQPDYLKAVNAMFGVAPLQNWKDYYAFRVIDAFASDLSEEVEKRHFLFHQTALSGVEEQKPLWRRGVEASNQILGELVGKL